MDRTLFLVFALIGFMVGGAMEAADVGVAAVIVLTIAGVCLAVWTIALGVHIGIRDALSDIDGSAARDEAERLLRARHGSDLIDTGRAPRPQRQDLPPNGS